MNQNKTPMWKRSLVLTVIFALMCQNVMSVMASYDITETSSLVMTDTLWEVSSDDAVDLTKSELPEAADEVIPEGTTGVEPEAIVQEEPEAAAEKSTETVPEVIEEDQVDDTTDVQLAAPDDEEVEAAEEEAFEESDTYRVDNLKATQTIESGSMTQYLLEGENGFSVTDGNGNAFSESNPVTIDSYVNITYKFKFPNNSDIKAGTELYLYLPEMIEISEQMQQKNDFESQDGIKATWFVDSNAMITVTFEEDVELSNVSGAIKISSKVDRLEFCEETLGFDVGTWDGIASFPTDYDSKEPRKVTIKKTNSGYDPSTRTIMWNITVTPVVSYNPASKSLAGITVVDTFTTPEQSLTGDVYLNNTSNPITVTKTDTGFTYTFPDDIEEGAATLIFQTKLADSLFSVDPEQAAEDTIKVTNTADALLNDEKVASSSAANTVSISRTKITKNCSSIDVDNSLIKWTIVINQEMLDRKNAVVIDYYPAGTEVYINPGTNQPDVTITGESNILDQASITDDQSNNKLMIALGDITKQITIQVTLKITDLSKLKEVVSNGSITYEMTNSAVLLYDDVQYAKIESTKPGITPGINKDLIKIKKEGKVLNYETEDNKFLDNTVVQWNITIQNILENKTKQLIFEDTLPNGHIYKEGSFQVNGKSAEPEINGSTIAYTLSDDDKSIDECLISFMVNLDLAETDQGKISNVGYIKFDDKVISDTGEIYLNEKLMLSKDSSFNPAKSSEDDTAIPTFSWKVDFNNATPAMNLTDVIVTDTLPEDHVLAEDTITLYSYGSAKTQESLSEYFDWTYDTSNGKTSIVFTLKAGKVIDKHFCLEFDTVMKDGVAPITATNEVTLESAKTSLLSASATETVGYEIPVVKDNTYQEGQIIEWTVDINKAEKGKDQTNYLYPGSYLEDQLIPALDLVQEEGSIVLYELQRKDKNSEYQVSSVKYVDGEYSYDAEKIFTYYLPKELDPAKAYRLVFKTMVVNASSTDIRNICTFKNVVSETKAEVSKVILKNIGGVAVLEGDNLIIQLKKTGISKETGKEVPLPDVAFEIFKKDDAGKETVLESGVTTENGIIRFTKKLLFDHTYYVRETSKPDGYADATDDVYEINISNGTSTDEKIQVTITKNGDSSTAVTQDVALDPDSNYFIIPFNLENKLEPDEITISKVDITGEKELSGATLTIYEANEDGSKGKQADQWISKAEPYKVPSGKLSVEKSYILEETSAPKGYGYAKDITFRIEKTGSVMVTDNGQEKDAEGNIVMMDELIKMSVSKINSAGGALAGAVLSIYETDDEGKATEIIASDRDGQLLTWESTKEEHDITGISPGTYVLHEEEAPWGYYVAYDIIFTVNKDGTITKVSEDGAIEGNMIIMTDLRYTEVMPEWIALVIKKTVTGTAGDKDKEFTFTLTLTDEDGVELEESFPYEGSKSGTIKSGQSVKLKHGESIQIMEIPLGANYQVAESGNEGYEVTAEGDVGSITDVGEVASFVNHKDKKEIIPTLTPTPTSGKVYSASLGRSITPTRIISRTAKTVKSGDITTVWIWIMICLVCAGAGVGVIIMKKRKAIKNN